MRTLLAAAIVSIACWGPASAIAQSTTAPTTEPTTRGSSATPAIDRLETALSHVGLSDEQTSRTTALLIELRHQLRDVPNLAPEDRRDTLRQVMGDGRRKLAEILTPQQLQALRDKQQAQASVPAPAPTPPAKVKPTTPDAVAMVPDMAGKPPGATPPAKPANDRPDSPAKAPAVDVPAGTFTGAVGARVPEFTLKRVPSGAVKSSAYANRVLVIEFGSYSVPTFRYRSTAMDALAKEYSGRADFVTIYTAEGYPAGEWDLGRNRDDNVSIAKHSDEAARLAAAEQMRAILKPTRAIAVDTMTQSLAGSFLAGAHSAFVVGRDGTIVARQQWCDPDGLRRHIDAAIAARVEVKQP
jgi:hypothetical protein